MIAEKHQIELYIPQRRPMIMIDTLIEACDDAATSNLLISEENIFVKEGFFTEPGMIENIAQTAAAQAGFFFISRDRSVPLGFIAAIRNLEISLLPPVNAVIETSVKIVNKVLDIAIVEGLIRYNDQEICKCELRIFIKV
jgi:3-hydroxyacyl-[acyl-carrier-protein] dehydratase